MKVSIIIPVYNGEKTINRCIDSILDQTLTDLELIVIDDGSSDATAQICKAYEEPRLFYCRKENGGPSSARNMGIAMARGEYISFVDADDYITTDMCEKMYVAAKERNADICVCDYTIDHSDAGTETYTDLLRGGHFDRKQIEDEVLRDFLGHIDDVGNIGKFDWAVIRRFFKRDFLCSVGLRFDETLSNSEDCLFTYIATHEANSMVYLKGQQLYINMRNAHSLTRKYLADYWQQRCRLMDELEAVVNRTQLAWDTQSFPLFVMRCVRPSFTNIAYGFVQVSALHSLKEFRAIVNDSRVEKMCAVTDPEAFNEEWNKLFDWCKNKRWITLYLYHMDVIQHNKFCHLVRRIQKGIDRWLNR